MLMTLEPLVNLIYECHRNIYLKTLISLESWTLFGHTQIMILFVGDGKPIVSFSVPSGF